MIADLQAEWGKLTSLRSPWICLLSATLLVPATAFTLANNVAYDIEQGRAPAGSATPPLEVLGSALQFGLAMFIAFAMLTITSECATGSIRSTLLAQPRRYRVLLAKTAAVTATATIAGAVVGAGTYAVIEPVLGDHAATGAPWPEVAMRSGLLVGLATILTSGIAAAVRSSVGTLAVCFGILVGLLAIPDPLGPWLPARAGVDWLTAGDAGSFAVLAGWALTAWVFGWSVLERLDA